jgi:hypothetical protein
MFALIAASILEWILLFFLLAVFLGCVIVYLNDRPGF